MFIDRVKIRIKAGDGGDGVTAFRREKFVPRGGPSGGDGGKGGDIWIEADEGYNTLLHLRYNPEHKAGRGRHGEGSNRHGKDGEDELLKVPIGTQVFDAATEELLFDFTETGQRFLAAKGGKGGWGNQHFATPTRRAPRFHYTGRPGEELELQLRIKIHRRCRAGRFSERRKIYFDFGDFRRETENCRLSVYNFRAESRRG